MCWDLNRPFDVGSRERKSFDTIQQRVMLCKRAGRGADAAGGRAAWQMDRRASSCECQASWAALQASRLATLAASYAF